MSGGKHKTRCCVPGCINTLENSPGLRFYRFPNATIFSYKQKRRNDWIASINRKNPDGSDWQPQNHTRICSKHFVGNEKSEDPRSSSYNPTIFPIVNDEIPIFEAPIKRCTRGKKRKSEENSQSSINSISKKCAVSKTSSENLLDRILEKNEFQSRDKKIIVDHKKKINQHVQVNFPEEKNSHCESFICNRFIYIDSKTNQNSLTSDVELQIFIPRAETIKRITKEHPKTVNRSCGNRNNSVNKHILNLLKLTTKIHKKNSTKEDDEFVDLAGVNFTDFQLLLKIMPETREINIINENRLLLFLLKIKSAFSYSALSVIFGIDERSAKKIFISTLKCLAVGARNFVFWPDREIIKSTMPEIFREKYGNCRVIIDRMEFEVEHPKSVDARINFYSHCTKRLTLKILVGFTPSGAISFLSKCHGGRTTDLQLTNCTHFFESLEADDVVLADKQFPQLKKKFKENGRGILQVMPQIACNNDFSAIQNEEFSSITSLRKLIKQNMENLRKFKILRKFTAKMLPYCDDIILVCCVLINLQQGIAKKLE